MLSVPDDLSPVGGRASGSGRARAKPRDSFAVATMLALAFGAAYLPVLQILRHQWATNDTYSFGVIVPFISAYLIWLQRARLTALPVAPSVWGLTVMVVAAGALLVGRATSIIAFQQLSMVLMLMGLVLLVLGHRLLRELAFPLAYLLLMLPVWEIVTDSLHYPAQLLSARLGSVLLQLTGIPVHREYEYLRLPNITLQVASACSGVNFLIAVIAIGLPQSYIRLRGWLPRAAVMIFAITIALVSNGLRVAAIGFLSYHELTATVHGPAHVLQGLFVSSIGLVAVLATVSLVGRRYPRLPEPDAAATAPRKTKAAIRSHFVSAGVIAAIMLLAVAVVRPERSLAARAGKGYELGTVGGHWQPVAGIVPARFVAGGSQEERMARVFRAPDGERMELFIGSLAYAAGDGSLTYRTIEFPRDVVASEIALGGEAAGVRVNRAVIQNIDRRTFVFYWYDLNGRLSTRHTVAKAYNVGRLFVGAPLGARLIVVVSDQPAGALDSQSVTAFVQDVVQAQAASTETVVD